MKDKMIEDAAPYAPERLARRQEALGALVGAVVVVLVVCLLFLL